MRLVSVSVGRPRLAMWNGQTVSTGIYKNPVEGRVVVRTLNLDGDRQADLNVHGGASKAVYGYPSEHYECWRRELPGTSLPFGMFGENLTTEGLDESVVRIGDRFRIGSAELLVTQPRVPCHKLAIKFGRADIIKRFLASGRSGFYFSVVQEGDVGAGDAIERRAHDENGLTVADIVRLYAGDTDDPAMLRRASETATLPESWRDRFRVRAEKISAR